MVKAQYIISLLKSINREGIGNVIAYLFQSDYFTAHCHHHHRYEGGLADHSLDVYIRMRALAPELHDESCRIVALFHDICTTHLDEFDSIGYHLHGKRSIALLDALGLELLEEERLAIRYHMHHVPSDQQSEVSKLWHFLHLCDKLSANDEGYTTKNA